MADTDVAKHELPENSPFEPIDRDEYNQPMPFPDGNACWSAQISSAFLAPTETTQVSDKELATRPCRSVGRHPARAEDFLKMLLSCICSYASFVLLITNLHCDPVFSRPTENLESVIITHPVYVGCECLRAHRCSRLILIVSARPGEFARRAGLDANTAAKSRLARPRDECACLSTGSILLFPRMRSDGWQKTH